MLGCWLSLNLCFSSWRQPRTLNNATTSCGALRCHSAGACPQAVTSCSDGWAGSSSSEGMAAMLSAEKILRPSSWQCSSCSSSTVSRFNQVDGRRCKAKDVVAVLEELTSLYRAPT